MIRMAEEQSDDSPAVFVFHFALIFFASVVFTDIIAND